MTRSASAEHGADSPAEDDAFADFYRSYLKRLVAFLLTQGANTTTAVEIAQDTMAAAYKSWADIKHPQAWARRVASRSPLRHTLAPKETPVDVLPEPSPLLRGDVDIEHWERRQDLLRALDGLPLRQRQVMALHLHGVTPTEIARTLDTTDGAVRQHLYEARKTLRTRLFAQGGES